MTNYITMEAYKSKFVEDVPGLVVRENDVLKDKIGNVQKTLDSMYYDYGRDTFRYSRH